MDGATVDEVYDTICTPEKLASIKCFELLRRWPASDTTFHLELPYDHIKEYVEASRDEILGGVPKEVQEASQMEWQWVGSTSIKGMAGTMNPDAVVLIKQLPPPKELIAALMKAGFLFFGSAPIHPQDLWFFKKVSNPGSPLDGSLYKIHVNEHGFAPAMVLVETRNRCYTDEWSFNNYRTSKIQAAKKLASGDLAGYKFEKSSCEFMVKLMEEYGWDKKAYDAGTKGSSS